MTEKIVELLYEYLLGRAPNPEGLAVFSAEWQAGRADAVVRALVDSPEFAARRSLDTSLQNRIRVGVVHVPKCAGASLQALLSARMPDAYVAPRYFYRSPLDGEFAAKWGGNSASIGDLARIFVSSRLVVGHYPAEILIEAGATNLFATVREPRSRLISLYGFWRSLPKEQLGGDVFQVVHEGLTSFLSSPTTRHAVHNVLAAHALSNMGYWDASLSVPSRWRRIRPFFGAASWPEEVPQMASKIGSLFEIASERRGETRLNATERDVSASDEQITPEDLELLEYHTVRDTETLEMMSKAGCLTYRSVDQRDAEFRATLARHGLYR